LTKGKKTSFARQIAIDGTPITKPGYARHLDDNQYIWYLENAQQIHEEGYITAWMGGTVTNPEEKLLERLAKDRNFLVFLESVIRNGEHPHNLSKFASYLADCLINNGQAVEIIVPELDQGSLLDSGRTQKTRKGKSKALVRSKVARSTLPTLGTFLDKGVVICHGNIEEVSALSGGTLYVDGDVNSLTQCDYGVVYVNGDVHHLGESEKVILIVTGKIHEYVTSRYSAGGLQQEVTPSPFIFTSHPLVGQRVGQKVGRHVTITNKANEFDGSYVVEKARLIGWTPQETTQKALELCREKIEVDLTRMRKIAAEITTAQGIAEFYRKFILGYIEGRVEGYYSHATSSPSYDD